MVVMIEKIILTNVDTFIQKVIFISMVSIQ